MTRGQALVIIAVIAIFATSSCLIPAYAHGISTCMTGAGGCALAKNDEQYSSIYSNNILNMDDDSGGVLTITGTLKNKYYNQELRVVPYLSIGGPQSNPFGSSELNNLLRMSYPLYNDPVSWYFRVESNLTNPVVIKPQEEINYEIKAYPLKAGVYHVHSTFIFDYLNDGRYHYYQSTGRGEPVTVIGATMPTMGEVTQLILPFAVGAIAIPVAVLKTRKAAKSDAHSRMREGIRLYFAVKASLETVWLVGLLVWFFFAAYPAFHSLEPRILSMIGMIALIAAITVSGYIAAVAESRKIQNIFAIGTAIASIIVYNLLGIISYYAWINGGASYYDLLPTSGVGYNYNAFELNSLVSLIGFAANAVVAVMSALVRREKYNTKVIAGLAAGIVAFVFFVIRVL